MVISWWNLWVEGQGSEGKATLAGMLVGKRACHVEGYQHQVHEGNERLIGLYNKDLAEGLDSLIALLPEGGCQKSVEPFSLDVSTLDGLTEKPAAHEAAYLVDMAKVEVLDTMGENRKAIAILDRHVWY